VKALYGHMADPEISVIREALIRLCVRVGFIEASMRLHQNPPSTPARSENMVNQSDDSAVNEPPSPGRARRPSTAHHVAGCPQVTPQRKASHDAMPGL
jgi:hypothetical protein